MTCLLKLILSIFVTAGLYLSSTGMLFAQENLAIRSLVTIDGECHNSMFESKKQKCKNRLLHSENKNGRIGFTYILDTPEQQAVLYSGNGPQETPSQNIRIQPIDTLIISGVRKDGSGKCLFENPYTKTPARFECEFKSTDGVIFSNYFLSDSNSPEYIITPR